MKELLNERSQRKYFNKGMALRVQEQQIASKVKARAAAIIKVSSHTKKIMSRIWLEIVPMVTDWDTRIVQAGEKFRDAVVVNQFPVAMIAHSFAILSQIQVVRATNAVLVS